MLKIKDNVDLKTLKKTWVQEKQNIFKRCVG